MPRRVENAAHQAEAIAMEPRAGPGEDGVTASTWLSVDQGASGFHTATTEAGQVVAAKGQEARLLGRFHLEAGPQTALPAAVPGNPFHHCGHGLGLQLAGGDM